MKRAPRSHQRHDLYDKYHDQDSETSRLLGECGLRRFATGLRTELWQAAASAAWNSTCLRDRRPPAIILLPRIAPKPTLGEQAQAISTEGVPAVLTINSMGTNRKENWLPFGLYQRTVFRAPFPSARRRRCHAPDIPLVPFRENSHYI